KTDFISDRNTVAAARLAPSADGTVPMPTMEGVDFKTKELANRNYRDGELKEDAAPPTPAVQMRTPDPVMQPPEVVKAIPLSPTPPPERATDPSRPPAPATTEPTSDTPKTVAKATPTSAVEKMIEEMDKEMARVETTKLPLQVRKAESSTEDKPPKPQEEEKP